MSRMDNVKNKIFYRKKSENQEAWDILKAVDEENQKLRHERKQLQERVKKLENIISEKDDEMHGLKTEFENSGDLAEFTVKVNGVLESAQKAAKDYLEANRHLKEKSEREAKEIISEANAYKEKVIKEAQVDARRIQKMNITVIQNLREEAQRIINSIAAEHESSMDMHDDSIDMQEVNVNMYDNSTDIHDNSMNIQDEKSHDDNNSKIAI